MTQNRPDALILDNGELADVRSVLDELGVRYGAEGDGVALVEVPLLVTSLRRARELHDAGHPLPKHALHLVVADPDEVDLRGALADASCDFVVRRPVDAAVLRLLTRRAGYHGPERRRLSRVAIGAPIEIRLEGDTEFRDAILAQVSIAGCGLITVEALPARGVSICFPEAMTQPRRLELTGRVVRSRGMSSADGLVHDTSVVFDDLRFSDRVTLRALMAGQPIDFRPGPALCTDARRATAPDDRERRAAQRQRFRQPALGGTGDLTRVLMGRDISPDGMRVEREPDLALGDPLRLALYASEQDDPVVVTAVVRRDDAEDGWYLGFDDPSERTRARILALMNALSAGDPAPEQPVWVVSEVLLGPGTS